MTAVDSKPAAKESASVSEKTADDIIKLLKDEKVEFVDVRFCDLPGVMQHFTIPASGVDEDLFESGVAFDGSSIRGFQAIHESDMLLLPDPDTPHKQPLPPPQNPTTTTHLSPPPPPH